MFVFWKFGVLFSCYLRFENRLLALLLTNQTLENSDQEKTQPEARNFIKKETLKQVSSYEVFKNTFL